MMLKNERLHEIIKILEMLGYLEEFLEEIEKYDYQPELEEDIFDSSQNIQL